MDLIQLRARGAFIEAPPVPTEVTWTHNDPATSEEVSDTFTVHVRRMSVGWIDRVREVHRMDPHRSSMAALIAGAVLLGEDGNESISYEDAYRLDFGLASVLLAAFNKVNKQEDAASPKD